MLRRFLSAVLILTLLCVELPVMLQLNNAAYAAEVFAEEETADEIIADAAGAVEEDIYDDVVTQSSEYPFLKRGDRDGDDSTANIVILQNRLIALEYLFDSADGVYGENTEIAIKLFQTEHGLRETGIADPETQKLLYSDQAHKAPVRMDSKNVVSRVQNKLIMWGFHTGAADGVNGTKTKSAVAEFKKYLTEYLKIYPTPSPEPVITPDPATLMGFDDGLLAMDEPIPSPEKEGEITQAVLDFVDGVYPFEVYRQTVQSGDKGEEVERVQRRLKQLKYLWNADGDFGDTTERALLYFQRKNGLDQSGIADENTQRRLFSADAIVSEEYVNAYKLIVDVSEQRVYVYQWDGDSYGIELGYCKCSTGILEPETATPLGTFQMGGPTGTGEWYYFKEFDCYAKWGSRIVGGILFHSVVYSAEKRLNKTSVRKLGRPASHGCIRLEVAKAKWIYDNCAPGTTCIIRQ